MTEKNQTPYLFRYKALLIGIALIGLIGLGVLVLWPRASCEGIFEQTAQQRQSAGRKWKPCLCIAGTGRD